MMTGLNTDPRKAKLNEARERHFQDVIQKHPERTTIAFREAQTDTRDIVNSAEVKGRVLDLGCGTGEIAVLLSRKGCEVTGYDIAPVAIAAAQKHQSHEPDDVRRRLSFQLGVGGPLPFGNHTFDTVLLNGVLSFEAHPTPLLKEAARVLKAGGKLVVFVPEGLADYESTHIRLFSSADLEKLLADYYDHVTVTATAGGKRLKAVCFNRQERVFPRIICQMNIKNEDRWLRDVLNGIARIADGIVILDDGSTDQTPWICQVHPAVMEYDRQENVPLDKVRDKNHILQMALRQKPDWILCMDGDELLEDSAARRIYHALRTKEPDVGGFDFEFLYMWNDLAHYRVDGIYNHILHPCLFSCDGQDLTNMCFLPTGHG
ncbi:methyltransferase domain-containing protein, partial [candidate division KSB1 bacterium]